MTRVYLALSLSALLLDLTGCAGSPGPAAARSATLLVEDPALIKGVLNNGLTYYVHRNLAPPASAELRLVVNAGSLQENDDQRGLAHFCEHMAFRGTESFPGNAIVDWLESLGMRFGPDLNAVTTFNETVYRFQVPTTDPAQVETALRVLEEIAQKVTFDPALLRKEADVINEERRLDEDAESRMRTAQYALLYGSARYAARLPIGDADIVRNARAEDLRRFYRAWYRPELMAVAAVGDFDPSVVAARIQQQFAALRSPAGSPPRPAVPWVDTPGTLYGPATDPEAASTRVTIYVRRPPVQVRTVADYRRGLVEELFNRMMSGRLEQVARQPETALEAATSASLRVVRGVDAYVLAAQVRGGRIRDALDTLASEALRAAREGFSSEELAGQKSALLADLSRDAEQRESHSSAFLAQTCVDAFLRGDVVLDPGTELEMSRQILPTIQREEVNAEWPLLLTENNRVVLVNAPTRYLSQVPAAPEVQEIVSRLRTGPRGTAGAAAASGPAVTAGAAAAAAPAAPLLFDADLAESAVRERTDIPALGLRRLTLANGAVVLLKPTDFTRGEVLFGAARAGGASLVPDADYVADLAASEAISFAGAGARDAGSLRAALAGAQVSVAPWVGDYGEGLRGRAEGGQTEKLFQLLYLTLTEPRRDPAAFEAWRQRAESRLLARSASPPAAFADAVRAQLLQNAFRSRPWTPDQVRALDVDTCLRLYRQQFAFPASFEFFFVGDFTLDGIEPLVRRYIGSLPGGGPPASWVDTGERPLAGAHDVELRMGREPRSRVEIIYSGQMGWSLENLARLEALARVLENRLRRAIRVDAGGSYIVTVEDLISRAPDQEYYLTVSFACAPERAAELARMARAEISRTADEGVDAALLSPVSQLLREDHDLSVRTNSFWLTALETIQANDVDPAALLDFESRMKTLTPEVVTATAREVLRTGNVLQVVQMPQADAASGNE